MDEVREGVRPLQPRWLSGSGGRVLAWALVALLVIVNFVTAAVATGCFMHNPTTEGIYMSVSSAERDADWLQCGYSGEKTETIGYQLHSWDDLREWHSGFKKGATWWKVDPHYMDAEFCETQPSALHDSRGCLLLTHDIPFANVTTYNTTEQLLNLLQEEWMTEYIYGEERIHIALCFKVDDFDVCGGDVIADNWLSLVDDLLETYQSFVESSGANIEFILDGDATPGGDPPRSCLRQRWRPLNATYILDDDGLAGMLSNNATNGTDRFQVMNTHIEYPPCTDKWLKEEASYSYGKFVDSRYPWLNWEPSDQYSILSVVDTYIDEGILHEEGFKFAINIDPVALEVYTGTRSGLAANDCLDAKASNPLVTTFDVQGERTLILVVYEERETHALEYVTLSASEGAVEQIGEPILLPAVATASAPVALSLIRNETFTGALLWFDDSSYEVYAVASDSLPLSLSILSHQESRNVTTPGQRSCASATLSTWPPVVIVTLTEKTHTTNSPSVLIQSMRLSPTTWELSMPDSSSVVSYAREISGSALSALLLDNPLAVKGLPCQEGDIASLLTFWSSDYDLYSSLVCLSSSADGEVTSTVFSQESPIDVGELSSVSLVQSSQGHVIALEVHSRGYCWNSHSHNTRSTVKVCDQIAKSTEYILSYTYALLSDWWEGHIEAPAHMSVCDHRALHGTFNTGGSPSVTLFADSQSSAGVSAVVVHEGMPLDIRSLLPEVEECGVALPTEKLVVDSWPLPPLH